MKNYSENGFNQIKNNLIKKKCTFVLDSKRDSNILINKSIKLFAVSKKQVDKQDKKLQSEILSLFGQVKKNINKYIVSNDFNINRIPQNCSSVNRDTINFKSMDIGQEFSYIDINHCFWRIAYIQGIISKKLYESILEKPHLKKFRNMSLSCIIAPRERTYFKNGIEQITITEDTSIYEAIYDNIRFFSYNLCGEIKNRIPKDTFLSHRTDAILCLTKSERLVIDIIEEHNLSCKVIKCKKIDEKTYLYNEQDVKRF